MFLIMNFCFICDVYLSKIRIFPLIVSTTYYEGVFKSNDFDVVPLSKSVGLSITDYK
jgi:hypothetical protein